MPDLSAERQAQVYAHFMFADWGDLGRGPDVYDCYGLLMAGRAMMGLSVPVDPMAASGDPRGVAAIVARAYKPGEWRRCDLGDGCAVFFPSLEKAQHVGLGLSGGVLDISKTGGVRFRSAAQISETRAEFWQWVG